MLPPSVGSRLNHAWRFIQTLPKSIDKFELVLKDAEHSAFTEGRLPGEKGKRNPNHHRAILALSTAFWDTYLKGDSVCQRMASQ